MDTDNLGTDAEKSSSKKESNGSDQSNTNHSNGAYVTKPQPLGSQPSGSENGSAPLRAISQPTSSTADSRSQSTTLGKRSPSPEPLAPETPAPRKIVDEVDGEIQELLRFELNSALLQFVQAERPVVLENFGIISPQRRTISQVHPMGTFGVVREEVLQTLVFEKCEDTSCLPEGRFPRLVDTRELVQSVYSRLPLSLQIRWSERELRRLVVAFFKAVRAEVVERGHSHQLRAVGHLYALHNRQGERPSDWFAGADIFMVPRQNRPLSLKSVRQFARPVLETASEVWEAHLGPPVWSGSFSLSYSLRELGFPESLINEYALTPDEIRVLMFVAPSSTSGEAGALEENGTSPTPLSQEYPGGERKITEHREIFLVTDGLRSVSRGSASRPPASEAQINGARLKHELVLHLTDRDLPQTRFDPQTHAPCSSKFCGSEPSPHLAWTPPMWTAQVLAAGSLLIASERSNPLRANAALALGRSLTGSRECRLSAVMAVPCPRFNTQQLSTDGGFHFANLVGITADEAALIASHGREHLLALLETRGFASTTATTRSSILARSHVSKAPAASTASVAAER